MARNDICSWQQGQFIDARQYTKAPDDWKAERRREESHLVRPAPTGNAICRAMSPDDAHWIAQRLNLASKLEQMTYDFATGKTDGSEIVRMVHEAVS